MPITFNRVVVLFIIATISGALGLETAAGYLLIVLAVVALVVGVGWYLIAWSERSLVPGIISAVAAIGTVVWIFVWVSLNHG